MFLGIIAKFLGQKKEGDASEMSRQVENSNWKRVNMRFRKRTKVLRFPYSPTFHENYELDLKKTKTTPKQNPELDLDWRTELRAALVCTHAKRRSLGRRLEKKTIQGKKTFKISLHLKMKQCKEEKGKAKKVISHWGLQVVTTQLWFDKIQSDAICGLTRNDEEDVFVVNSS